MKPIHVFPLIAALVLASMGVWMTERHAPPAANTGERSHEPVAPLPEVIVEAPIIEREVECPALHPLVVAALAEERCSVKEGGRCTLRCAPGEEASGPTDIVCSRESTWEPGLPTCTRIECPEINTDAVSGPVATTCARHVNNTCEFKCPDGKVMHGSALLKCGVKGMWEGVPPTCVDKGRECMDMLLLHDNVRVARTCGIADGDVCGPLHCAEGMTMLGEPSITCRDGRWSNPSPICGFAGDFNNPKLSWRDRWDYQRSYTVAPTMYRQPRETTPRGKRPLVLYSNAAFVNANYCGWNSTSRCRLGADAASADVVIEARYPDVRPASKVFIHVVLAEGRVVETRWTKDGARVPPNVFTANYRYDSDLPTTPNEWTWGRTGAPPIQGSLSRMLVDINIDAKNRWESEGLKPVISLESGCPAEAIRKRMSRLIQEYVVLDGIGCHELTTTEDRYWNDVFEFEHSADLRIRHRYKFCLVLHATNDTSYIPPAFYYSIQAGCVPIIMGAKKSQYSPVVPVDHSVIFAADYATDYDLAKYIKELDKDDALYMEYHTWRQDGFLGGWMQSWELSYSTLMCRACDVFYDSMRDRLDA